MAVLIDTPEFIVDSQLQAIKALQDTLEHWAGYTSAPTATTDLPRRTLSTWNHQTPRVPTVTPVRPPDPRVQCLVHHSPPLVKPISNGYIPSNHRPISQQLCYESAPKKLEPTAATDQPVAHHT